MAWAGPGSYSLEASNTSADVLCDALIDKLRMLKCPQLSERPLKIHRTYFVSSTGAQGDQFFQFLRLVAWLLPQCDRLHFAEPQQHDDPNLACQSVVDELRDLGFRAPSWPAQTLRSGCGEAVCAVLDGLASIALQRVSFGKPQHSAEASSAVEREPDDKGDLTGLPADQEGGADDEDDDAAQQPGGSGMPPPSPGGQETGILTSSVTPTDWRVELERVKLQLSGAIAVEAKDWRLNLAETRGQHGVLVKLFPEAKLVLERIANEVAASLEKIEVREKHYNGRMEDKAVEFRTAQEELANAESRYTSLSATVSQINNDLHGVSKRLEVVKDDISSRVDSAGDASPLIKIKTAIEQLHTELKSMEVRMGVVRSGLLQVELRGLSSKDDKELIKGGADGAGADEDEF